MRAPTQADCTDSLPWKTTHRVDLVFCGQPATGHLASYLSITSSDGIHTMQRLLTDRQLRDKLGGCSSMTLWRMRRDGKLPEPRKLGHKNVTPQDEADAAIAVLIGNE